MLQQKFELCVRAVSLFGCFSKIAWNLTSRNAWCITNQLFQINTHPPVLARGPGQIGLAFKFWVQSFFHGEQNVKFAQNLKNLKKIQGILIRNNAFVAWASLPGAATHHTWLYMACRDEILLSRRAILFYSRQQLIQNRQRTIWDFWVQKWS